MLEILNTFVEHLYYETSSGYGYPLCMFCNLNMDIINMQKKQQQQKVRNTGRSADS